jgi:hypothetical protein
VENFEGYSDGGFVSQNADWSGAADWQISTQGGNKVLVLQAPSSDLGLLYTGEQFSSAGEGYTMMMTMYAASGWPWASNYSGWLCDANGSNPTAGDHAYRFIAAGGSSLMAIGGGSVSGTPFTLSWDTPTYYRQYRSGDNVKIYVSASPIDATNSGTLIIDGTVPGLGAGGNFVGLYGVGTVAYDNIALYQGNVVPEPVTIGLLMMGSLMLRRRK